MTGLTVSNLHAAFASLGQEIGPGKPLAILVVGGAAGILTGELRHRLTTEDVDVMAYLPPGSDHEIDDDAIRAVGRSLDLPASWFEDSQVRLKAVYLPPDWHRRAIQIGVFGRLTVLAAGRLDLLAMKIGAARAKDRQDVAAMKPTSEEVVWVKAFLASIADQTDVTKAMMFLESLEMI